MLCENCGFTNLDDANYCSMCGKSIQKVSDAAISVAGPPCPFCKSQNEENVVFCRSCGESIKKRATRKVREVAVVGAGALLESRPAMDEIDEEADDRIERVSETADGDGRTVEEPVSARHESFIAKLDKLEEELEARQSLPIVEKLEQEFDERQNTLDSLSAALDSLISDLLEVEIHEYAIPDFIHPDESGFPSMDPASYEKKPPVQKKRSLHEILLIAALITAIFLVGASFGLWGSYFLGL